MVNHPKAVRLPGPRVLIAVLAALVLSACAAHSGANGRPGAGVGYRVAHFAEIPARSILSRPAPMRFYQRRHARRFLHPAF